MNQTTAKNDVGVLTSQLVIPGVSGVKHTIKGISVSCGDQPIFTALKVGTLYKFFGYASAGNPISEFLEIESGDGETIELFTNTTNENNGSIASTIVYEPKS